MNELEIIISVHAVTTLMMGGLIWFVQLVHYPLMVYVQDETFARFEREHMRRTTWIVAPLMMLEAVSAVGLLIFVDGTVARLLALVGVTLVALIWISTATLQAPFHRELARNRDWRQIGRLVSSNWIRTVAWTFRACIAVIFVS